MYNSYTSNLKLRKRKQNNFVQFFYKAETHIKENKPILFITDPSFNFLGLIDVTLAALPLLGIKGCDK